MHTHAVTYRSPDGLTQCLSHALRHCPSGKTARLQHQDAFAGCLRPRFVEENEGYNSALAGSWRRLQDGRRIARECFPERRQDGVNGEARSEHQVIVARHAPTAKQIQPTMSATPPRGVMMPRGRGAPKVSA